MSISGYANLSVLRKFPLGNKFTVPISKTLPTCEYVHGLYDHHWPINETQTFTKPLQLHTGELLYCDPKVVSGTFVTHYQHHSKNIHHVASRNNAVKSSWYRVALRHCASGFYVREMNHHPDSSQHFFHLKPNRPFLMLLAPPNPILHLEDVTAYLINQDTAHSPLMRGLVIAPCVWHSPPIPLHKHPQEIFTQQTQSHNCILWDTLEKYSKWIHIR